MQWLFRWITTLCAVISVDLIKMTLSYNRHIASYWKKGTAVVYALFETFWETAKGKLIHLYCCCFTKSYQSGSYDKRKKTCLHLYHIYLNGINVCIALYITWQMMFYLLQGKYENISDALKYYKLSFAICSAMYINQYLHWTYKNPKSSIWRKHIVINRFIHFINTSYSLTEIP